VLLAQLARRRQRLVDVPGLDATSRLTVFSNSTTPPDGAGEEFFNEDLGIERCDGTVEVRG
jgi:hypothetical protein